MRWSLIRVLVPHSWTARLPISKDMGHHRGEGLVLHQGDSDQGDSDRLDRPLREHSSPFNPLTAVRFKNGLLSSPPSRRSPVEGAFSPDGLLEARFRVENAPNLREGEQLLMR